jgi:hypothetical protein
VNDSINVTATKVLTITIDGLPQTVNLTAILVTSVSSLPTATAAYRGVIAIVQGGNGVADALYQCMKSATNTYSWVSIIVGS